jgi:hypothetical protein
MPRIIYEYLPQRAAMDLYKIAQRLLTGIILISSCTNLVCQDKITREPVQPIIINGLNYLNDKDLNFKKDNILFLTYQDSSRYYKLERFEEGKVLTYEIAPPNFESLNSAPIVLEFDSISDIIWINGKKWTAILNTIHTLPFEDLQGKLYDKEFEKIKSIFNEATYFNKIYDTFGSIKKIKSTTDKANFFNSQGQLTEFKMDITYPRQARENNIQGNVRIGYVLTSGSKPVDFYVFEDPGYGCAQSVIDAINKLSSDIQSNGLIKSDPVYIEVTTCFKLQ